MPDQEAHSGMGDALEPLTDELVDALYGELRRAAGALMAQERAGGAGHTLQPTALVHEVWIRLAPDDRRWNGRSHFLRTAAQAMRRLLVDHARAKGADRRGGGWTREPLDAVEMTQQESDVDLIALDAALDRLARLDARKAEIVRLRYFAGLTIEETAAALGLGRTTVKDEWTHARLLLLREISDGDPAP